MHELGAWVHHFSPVAFEVGPLTVRWYGLSYVVAFMIGWFILFRLSKARLIRLEPHRVGDLMIAVILGVLLGGRMGYVFFYQPSLLTSFGGGFPWWGVLRISEGGMASHGGMIGIIVACIVFGRSTRVSALHLLDALALVGPPGIFLGRVANFVNGELLGRIVAGPGARAPWWSVRYPQELLDRPGEIDLTLDQTVAIYQLADAPLESTWDTVVGTLLQRVQSGDAVLTKELANYLNARHPSQLYQAMVEGVLLFGALWWIWRKPRRDGVILAWFLILYGIGRVVTEFWRLPDSHFDVPRPMGLSRGQWFSVVMVACGLALLFYVRGRKLTQSSGGWMPYKTEPSRTSPGNS